MSNLNKDISLGVLFITGIYGFMNGSFIVSTVIFAVAAVISNISFNQEKNKEI
ncbi:MAG: hypothetical protein KAH20_08765 [Methylococcales bacterium]|nr:hypothetical protein [Methylococcales bacterium]